VPGYGTGGYGTGPYGVGGGATAPLAGGRGSTEVTARAGVHTPAPGPGSTGTAGAGGASQWR
jgi:hypothetical protein